MQYYKIFEIKYLNFMLKQSSKHFFIKQFINILEVVKSRAWKFYWNLLDLCI